ncbi:Disease resistance protein [Artemisia annua]|uniref:Disease resistance protein n=1 Tax=Artemisia annua TaxID=35608 RepID=A0A2U1L197_ARTAN|nr:Disease resistance protein [Artemisia annua]
MADPITSALVSDMVGRLTSKAIQEYGLLRELKTDLSALEKTFKQIQGVLYDAEMRQTNEKGVEEWLKSLKSASLIWRIAQKVKNIRKKLDEVDANRSKFQLTPNTTSKDDAGISGEISNRETSSLVNLSKIYGRDEEKKMIVDKICNQDIGITHDNNDVRVYAIWGMGGIGKTTLAQYVYNHETVKKHFELKCWVYDSAVFDVKRIIKDICGSEDSGLDALQACLQNKLRGKKFFIVMDDVWIENMDMEKWDELCKALSCGTKGSTVMVTTRIENTAQLMARTPELQHNVAVLSKEESWSLFKMIAFPGGGDQGENVRELERVGRQIVEKCKGLPLAVKTLGSLMSTKKWVNEWQLVNSKFVLEMQDNCILPALRLSYDSLLPHMKRCFAYCCLFSKGEKMSKDLLIELWMANEFIPSQGDVSLYLLGEEIFSCLVRRSFFQDVVEEDDLKKLRSVRSMFVPSNIDYTSNIRQISNHVYLRVLYLHRIESSTLPKAICKLIHLRYLKISRSNITVLPESIINLQNLQVLILRECWKFRELPKGLRYMRNLQRLDARDCPELKRMPVGIAELTNLRRLSQFVVGKDDGPRIGELGNLNLLGWELILSGLENVGGLRDAKSANLKDKTNLKFLRLDWSWDRSETFDSEVLEGLEPNSGLRELTISDYMGRVISPIWMVKLVNLTSIGFYDLRRCDHLAPLGKLPGLKSIILWKMLSLKCFHDDDNTTLSDEILFPNLHKLFIGYCSSLVSLPSNFPKLWSLDISYCDELRSLPHEIQSFKDLNQIIIEDCKILSRRCEKEIGEDWPKISHIPRLFISQTPRTNDEDEHKKEDNKEDEDEHKHEDNKKNEDEHKNGDNKEDEDELGNEDENKIFDSEVLEGLEPNSGLQELTISDYMGRVISPIWMVKLVNLTSIGFYDLRRCDHLAPLGKLPGLKSIILWKMLSLKCFHDDDNTTLSDEILFPNLHKLFIGYCSSLVSLPICEKLMFITFWFVFRTNDEDEHKKEDNKEDEDEHKHEDNKKNEDEHKNGDNKEDEDELGNEDENSEKHKHED